MSMIQNQIENLRYVAGTFENVPMRNLLNQAASTIESFSAKLEIQGNEEEGEKSILIIDTPKFCIDCPCHFAGETGMVMCGVEKRELLSDDIQTYKAEWCPLSSVPVK